MKKMATSKTKREILKKAMSVKYCNSTRFEYLDDEEKPLIYNAMQIYATQEAIAFVNWLSYQDIKGRTTRKLFKDYKKSTCKQSEFGDPDITLPSNN